MSRKPLFRPGDAIPVILALVIGLLPVSGPPEPGETTRVAVITLDGREEYDIPLDTLLALPVRSGTAEVEIRGGQARIVSSPCPRGWCMDMGWIGKPGQAAVCMPEGLIIEIRGGGVIPDAVSY